MVLKTKNNIEILLFNKNIEITETININGVQRINTVDVYVEDIKTLIEALAKIDKSYGEIKHERV